VFHSPYNKLIKKSGARMLYNDWIRNSNLPIFKKSGNLKVNDTLQVSDLQEIW